MLDELNKFSDYMLSHVEERIQDAQTMLIKVDNDIEKKKDLLVENKNIRDFTGVIDSKIVVPFLSKNIECNSNKIRTYSKENISRLKPSENTINSNMKSRQIIALSEKGLNEAEIAKKLNIGRGEIQLILGMKNGIVSC